MREISTFPEEICAMPLANTSDDAAPRQGYFSSEYHGYEHATEYVRKDIFQALEAENKRLREAKPDKLTTTPDPIVSMIECDGAVYVATERQVFRMNNAAAMPTEFYVMRFKGGADAQGDN